MHTEAGELHSPERKEQHLYNWCCLSSSRFFQPSSDEKDTNTLSSVRGRGEEWYWGLSSAEVRSVGGWRNENSCCRECKCISQGWKESLGNFKEPAEVLNFPHEAYQHVYVNFPARWEKVNKVTRLKEWLLTLRKSWKQGPPGVNVSIAHMGGLEVPSGSGRSPVKPG